MDGVGGCGLRPQRSTWPWWSCACWRWALGVVGLAAVGAVSAQAGCDVAMAVLSAPSVQGDAQADVQGGVPGAGPPSALFATWPVVRPGDCQAAAWSADGRWLAVGVGPGPGVGPHTASAPPMLHLYRTQPLAWAATHPVAMLNQRAALAVARIVPAPGRRSWVVALAGLPELWEVSLNEQAEPIFDGLVHDYRMGEAIAKPGFLGVRRTPLAQPVQLLALDGSGAHAFTLPCTDASCPAPVSAAVAASAAAPHRVNVINLDVRRAVGSFPVPPGAHPQHSEPVAPCHGAPVVRLGTLANGLPWVVSAQRPWAEVAPCSTIQQEKLFK